MSSPQKTFIPSDPFLLMSQIFWMIKYRGEMRQLPFIEFELRLEKWGTGSVNRKKKYYIKLRERLVLDRVLYT